MDNLRKDVKLITDRINFYKSLKIEDPFKIEMQLMEDLPEQYSEFPWLIKRMCKSSDTTWLDKMMSSLTSVVNGEKNLSRVEFELGTELKEKFVDPLIKNNN
jgi:hypothetical protein